MLKATRQAKSWMILTLCQEIKETNPGVEITLSELTTREDNPEAKKTVTEVNTLFENYCTATNMYLIKHKNITDRSLNKFNLHLLCEELYTVF